MQSPNIEQMIDTHSHIYLDDFKEGFDDMLARAKEQGIDEIYLPNIDVESIANLKDVAANYPQCKPMMGLHPGSVKEDYEEQLAVILSELDTNKYYAVGEIGMDLYWDKTFVEEQRKAFAIQIEKAKELALPIVIHCRDAFDETFEILEEHQNEKLFGIFHCFTGNYEQAQRALAFNMKLGIGGVVTFKNAGLDKVVEQLKIEDLVLETDAPFLAPAPHRGKRNEPAYISLVALRVASLLNIPLAEVDKITTANAKAIFER